MSVAEFTSALSSDDSEYLRRFEDVLRQNRYEFDMFRTQSPPSLELSPEITSNSPIFPQFLLEDFTPKTCEVPPHSKNSARVRSADLSFLTNINFSPQHYRENFWSENSLPKEHRVYLGYDEDLGPICACITGDDNIYTVLLKTYWRTSKIIVDEEMLPPSPVKSTQLIAPKAYSIILYLALEKYLDELEEDWFRLLNWQQKIDFSTPYNRDAVDKFMTDHAGYIEDLKAAVTFSISAPQVAKEDLPRVVGQLELLEDSAISKPLLNIERKLLQRYIFTDIITHFSGLNRTMEQRDTYNAFLDMCGHMVVHKGTPVEHEELMRPEIITEKFDDPLETQERREIVFKELLESERKYVKKINAIVNVFVKPLQECCDSYNSVIRPYDIKALFNNIEKVVEVNQMFLAELEIFNTTHGNLGALCDQHVSNFNVYETYINGYKYSLEYTCALERKNNAYYNFMMNARDHPDCDKLAIKDLIVMPVQRLPRYKLLFTEYLRFTPKDHPEYRGLYSALLKINEISNLGGQRLSENAIALSNMLRTITDCPAKLMSSSRFLITQLDCVECDISTCSHQENVTLFLLSDCLLITRRPRDHISSKKHHTFLSWISLNGIDALDPDLGVPIVNPNGIMIRGALEYSEDLYWDHQELHLYEAFNPSDKDRFYGELCKAIAVCKAIASGSTCIMKTINDVNMFFFIHQPEDYSNTKFKSETALHYIENITVPISRYFQSPHSSLTHGMVRGLNCRFSLCIKSKVPVPNLDGYIPKEALEVLVPNAYPHNTARYHLPNEFRDLFFHHLIYNAAALRATPAYLYKQQLINRCVLDSLFGLHFPACRISQQYLGRLKSISRTYKNDRHVLISNGSAIVSMHPRKNSHRQYPQHRLGTQKSDTFRDISKARSLTDPSPLVPSIAEFMLPFTSISTSKSRNSFCAKTTSSPTTITSRFDVSQTKSDSGVQRKRGSTFTKVSRFFSWGK